MGVLSRPQHPAILARAKAGGELGEATAPVRKQREQGWPWDMPQHPAAHARAGAGRRLGQSTIPTDTQESKACVNHVKGLGGSS